MKIHSSKGFVDIFSAKIKPMFYSMKFSAGTIAIDEMQRKEPSWIKLNDFTLPRANTTSCVDTGREKMQEEIFRYSRELNRFNLSFEQIASKSPEKGQNNILQVARLISNEPDLKQKLFKNLKLPLDLLAQYTDFKVEYLKKHEPAIISLTLLFHGNYQHLQNYLTKG